MQNQNEVGDSREEAAEVLRDDARVLETGAVTLDAAAQVLDAEADCLDNDRREIHFTVDGEPFETHERDRTPNEILVIAGLKPELRYLEEVSPAEISFKDRGEERIRMVNHMVFISLSIGPTPTS